MYVRSSGKVYRLVRFPPKLHTFAVRCRRSSLVWPRKFSIFQYYNFWKFVIFYLHSSVAVLQSPMILKSELFLAWLQQCQFFFIIVKFLTTLCTITRFQLKLSYFKIDSGGYLAQFMKCRSIWLNWKLFGNILIRFLWMSLPYFQTDLSLILIGS